MQESKLTLVNSGNTGGLYSEILNACEGHVRNNGTVSGNTILQSDGNSEVYWENNGKCDFIYAWGFDGTHIRFINSAVVGMVATGAELGAEVSFVNNGIITNSEPDHGSGDGNEWGDYSVVIDIDENSRLEFTGSGTVYPGKQKNGNEELIAGPFVAYDIHDLEVTDDREENERRIKEIAGHVDFNWQQVEKVDGASWIVAVYKDDDNKLQVRLSSPLKPEPEQPQDGEIIEGEDAFHDTPLVQVPTIVFPDGTDSSLDMRM